MTSEAVARPRAQGRLDSVTLTVPLKVSRNVRMQVMVAALVAIAALPLAPWPVVAVWTVIVSAVVCIEEYLGAKAPLGGGWARASRLMGPSLAVSSATCYALAAAFIINARTAGSSVFAFALIAVAMVYILLRSYRKPWTFLISIAPHMALLGWIALGLTRQYIAAGDYVSAVTPSATLALFLALFWAGRQQLADSWNALETARAQAFERERVAAAANEAKSSFLATMSHEIRTPLNGVLGMAQAMTVDELTGVQRERLKVIRRAGESLLAVLNDLLDLSKIEAHKLELEIQEFDLNHLTRGVAAAFAPMADKKGVGFVFEIEKDALGLYRGDTTRLRQILYNLISNAVKFTDRGEVRVSVYRDAGGVSFRISDTGIGIGDADLARLFENFFQADNTNTRRFGGSGLGLAICRELVSLMGGTIEPFSTPGKGSTFVLSLPMPRLGDAPAMAPERAPPAPQEPTNLRVLCAEDNDVNQLVLKTLLLQAGIEPTIVSDGRQAVNAWETGDWDVILMDVQMPELDGPGASRVIRMRESETGRRRTPIIALTANAMAHQIVQYEAAGMDSVVPKPIEITRLFGAIETALGEAEDADWGPAAARA